MGIKGDSQELFIGKQEIVIKDWSLFGKPKRIDYQNITKIEYCYKSLTEGGYVDFYDGYKNFDRFRFSKKSNPGIERAMEYIQENHPNIEVFQHDPSDDPVYSKNVFIGILSLFCSWPIGLILYWCTGKRTTSEKVIFTLSVIAIQIFFVAMYIWYINIQLSEFNSYMNQLNSMF